MWCWVPDGGGNDTNGLNEYNDDNYDTFNGYNDDCVLW